MLKSDSYNILSGPLLSARTTKTATLAGANEPATQATRPARRARNTGEAKHSVTLYFLPSIHVLHGVQLFDRGKLGPLVVDKRQRQTC